LVAAAAAVRNPQLTRETEMLSVVGKRRKPHLIALGTLLCAEVLGEEDVDVNLDVVEILKFLSGFWKRIPKPDRKSKFEEFLKTSDSAVEASQSLSRDQVHDHPAPKNDQQAPKNDLPNERGPTQPAVKKSVANKRTTAAETEEENDEDDQDHDAEMEEEELSINDTALLYEPRKWKGLFEEELLEQKLRLEFLPVQKAGSWEYSMCENAILVLTKGYFQGLDVSLCQIMIDQFLLRLKLVMEGVPGQKVNSAMKKLSMNKLPKRYRNILTQAALSKDQFGQRAYRDTEASDPYFRGRGRGNGRSNSASSRGSNRVPNDLWKTLSDEQKSLLLKRR